MAFFYHEAIKMYIKRSGKFMALAIVQSVDDVQTRLLQAAEELFMVNEYNKVTTRMLAQKAQTSTSMIQYYFSDKQKLYEEMIRQQFKRIEQVFDDSVTSENGLDFEKLMKGYYRIHSEHPKFPAFLTQILAYKNGPGFMLVSDILDKKRDKIQRVILAGQNKNQLGGHVHVDVLRILMMSASIFPFLIKCLLDRSQKVESSTLLLEKVMATAGRSLAEYARPKSSSYHPDNLLARKITDQSQSIELQ